MRITTRRRYAIDPVHARAIHPSRNTVRPACRQSCRRRPFPWPGSAGALMAVALLATAIRFAHPLGGLAGCRFLRCASLRLRSRHPARPPPRPPARPEAGPHQCLVCSDRLGRRASRCAWWHAGRDTRRPSCRWAGRSRQPSRLLRRHAVCWVLGPSCAAVAWRHAGSAHRAPPRRPHPWVRGTCGGIFNAVGRETSPPFLMFATRLNSHPHPRRPQGRGEESQARGSVFRNPTPGPAGRLS